MYDSGSKLAWPCSTVVLGFILMDASNHLSFKTAETNVKNCPCFFYSIPGDIKVVLGEGMPFYKNPFEKGRLIIKFSVSLQLMISLVLHGKRV